MKILIIDDDKVFLDKMQKLLTLNDYTIKTAISAEAALKIIDEDIFDLILTDLKMSGMSGLDLLKNIRQSGINTLVIMITGYGSIELAVESMKAGAYDFILKPFDITILLNKIKEIEKELKIIKDLETSGILKISNT